VVGPVTRFRALGIDAEPDLPLPPGVLGLIAGTDDEQPMLRALAAGDPGVNWSRLLFCAKEAVFKAWSPLTGSWLGCAGAEVRIRTDGTFRARVRPTPGTPPAGVTGGVDTFTGRWLARDGLLLAAVVVPAPSSSASPDTAEIHPTCASLAPAQQP
jgi:4'-phosphopantetheinyl transferase EntD